MQHNLSKDAVRQLVFWKITNTNYSCYLKQVLEEIIKKDVAYIDPHRQLQFTEYGKSLVAYLTSTQDKTSDKTKKPKRTYTEKEMIECFNQARVLEPIGLEFEHKHKSAIDYLKSLKNVTY